MAYLLDTNILVHLVRNSPKSAAIDQQFGLLGSEHDLYMSVVSKGEILSFAKQSAWGKPKMNRLFALLENISSVPLLF